MGNLVFQATLGGQVNLVGPNTASTFNLNVPAVSSTIASLAAQTFAGAQTFTLDATISGLTVGKGGGAVSTNTAVGASALAVNTTGDSNVALGTQALAANTTGYANSATGQLALLTNTTGNLNTATGSSALRLNTTGSNNTALGQSALYSNTTASNNTAVGYVALYSNTTGTPNTAVGRASLYTNTTGGFNVAVGGTDGAINATLGVNSTGSYNSAVGYGSLGNNTTASNNTAVGYQAGYTSSLSSYNVFLGNQAGYTHNLGSLGNGLNTCVGNASGYSLTTGTLNQFLGSGSGYYISSGSKNTILGGYNGNQGGLDIRTASNYIVLSDGDGNPRASCSNVGVWSFGNSTLNGGGIGVSYDGNSYAGANFVDNSSGSTTHNAVLFYRGATNTGYIQITGTTTSYGSASDQRLKENIVDAPSAISLVNNIKVRSFNFVSDKSLVKYGFIAQELNQVAPDAVVIGTDKENGSMEIPWGVDASKLVPYLVKAIQELKAEVDSLKQQLGN